MREVAQQNGISREVHDAVEDGGAGEAFSKFWPELLLGQGGLVTVILASWLGIRARRRRKAERNC